jgi:hypothetical protein
MNFASTQLPVAILAAEVVTGTGIIAVGPPGATAWCLAM